MSSYTAVIAGTTESKFVIERLLKQGKKPVAFVATQLGTEMLSQYDIPIEEGRKDEQEFLAKLDILADRAFEDQCTTANPRVPLVSEIKQIMLDSYYGK